jgi:urea ABC transporter permease protein UrtC
MAGLIGRYEIDLLSLALIFGMFALSLDLAWGITGILSLGHSAYFGLGAYMMGFALREFMIYGPPPEPSVMNTYLGLALAIIVPGALALAIGFIGFYGRVRSIYFGLIVLALTLILEKEIIDLYFITGGTNGINNIPKMAIGIGDWASLVLRSPVQFYYAVLLIVFITYLFTRKLVNSPFGRVLIAIRENEERVETFGYNTLKYKLIAYVISAQIAGIAGALFAPLNVIVTPTLFNLVSAAQVFVWVIVGGQGTLIGPLMGAVVLKFIEAWLGDLFKQEYIIILGALLILIILFLPRGLIGSLITTQYQQTRRLIKRKG